MNKTWVWILVSVLVLGLVAFPFLRGAPAYSPYTMMGNGYGWHMPMMQGSYGMWGMGMWWMWLIQLSLLALIGLGIAALTKYLKTVK